MLSAAPDTLETAPQNELRMTSTPSGISTPSRAVRFQKAVSIILSVEGSSISSTAVGIPSAPLNPLIIFIPSEKINFVAAGHTTLTPSLSITVSTRRTVVSPSIVAYAGIETTG